MGSNIAVKGLSANKFPMVGTDKILEDSIITKTGDDIIISGGLQVNGDILKNGNVFVVESNNVVIQDRILTLANNNTLSLTTGYANPELQPDSGQIVYLENRKPIARASDQTEDIKLIIEF